VYPAGRKPAWCKHIPDPYITLAAVAATTDLEIGTAVSLAAEHDPIVLAKAIATLDQLSGGRCSCKSTRRPWPTPKPCWTGLRS
jgi:alkanesulfonate monooxygenase SsuD/methylene tetrahydromethanopterin reductase-like flavin-dependent oxidoreductase (luciferase family)